VQWEQQSHKEGNKAAEPGCAHVDKEVLSGNIVHPVYMAAQHAEILVLHKKRVITTNQEVHPVNHEINLWIGLYNHVEQVK
jgi:hypothetical protein